MKMKRYLKNGIICAGTETIYFYAMFSVLFYMMNFPCDAAAVLQTALVNFMFWTLPMLSGFILFFFLMNNNISEWAKTLGIFVALKLFITLSFLILPLLGFESESYDDLRILYLFARIMFCYLAGNGIGLLSSFIATIIEYKKAVV